MKFSFRFAFFSKSGISLLNSISVGVLGAGLVSNSPATFAAQSNKSDLNEIARWRTNTDMGKKFVVQGKLDEAEAKFSIALDASIRGFGLDAPHVAMSCNNLAEVLRVQGKPEEAIDLYQQAVDVFVMHYTLEDPRTATTYYNLADALYFSERYSEAKVAAQKGFDGMKGALGSERSETLSIQVLLAKCELRLMHRKKAISHLLTCHDVLIKKDLKLMEYAQVAGDVLHMLLELNEEKQVKNLVPFITGCFAECKKESSLQVQQLTDRLVDILIKKRRFSDAMEMAVCCETCMRRLEHTESLSLAMAIRKQAFIHLRDPEKSDEKAASLLFDSFNMIWKLFAKIPGDSGMSSKVYEFVEKWTGGKHTEEEKEARKHLLMNCVYDLTQTAKLIIECFEAYENMNIQQKAELTDCLKHCVDVLQQPEIVVYLQEMSKIAQHSKHCQELVSWKHEIETWLPNNT